MAWNLDRSEMVKLQQAQESCNQLTIQFQLQYEGKVCIDFFVVRVMILETAIAASNMAPISRGLQ